MTDRDENAPQETVTIGIAFHAELDVIKAAGTAGPEVGSDG